MLTDVTVRPAPVPKLLYRGHRISECKVSHGELLIAKGCAIQPAFKDKIIHEAARSALNEDALMLCSRSITKAEENVLQACCLCRRPMDSSGSGVGRDQGGVDDEIADLPPEHIGGAEVETVGAVLITIDQTKCACEGRKRSDNWQAIWIANELCIVVVDD